MKKKILFLVTLLIALMGFGTMVSAKTTVVDGKVNRIDNVMISDPLSEVTKFNVSGGKGTGSDVYRVKISLNNAAYVGITVNSSVTTGKISVNGGLLNNATLTLNEIQLGDPIGGVMNIYTNDTYREIYALEKGTYYLVFNGKGNDESSGDVRVKIEAQYVDRMGGYDGTTRDNAISLINNTMSTGYFSLLYREQYFKLTLKRKSTVNFDVSVVNTPNHYKQASVEYRLISVNGLSFSSEMVSTIASPLYESSKTTQNFTLEPGTYYIKTYQSLGQSALIDVTPHIKELKTPVKKTLRTPRLKKLKKGAKKISGTATRGATVKVKIGKKTYSARANGKGRFSVKLRSRLKKGGKVTVYAVKSGYNNSKKKTYRVK